MGSCPTFITKGLWLWCQFVALRALELKISGTLGQLTVTILDIWTHESMDMSRDFLFLLVLTITSYSSSTTDLVATVPSIHLVIPCYNEAKRLPTEEFLAYIDSHPSVRFLFVDDGSTDSTAIMLRALRDQRPESASVLELEHNCGKAEATRRGMVKAIRDLGSTELDGSHTVGFWDGDLATPLSAVDDFTEVLAQDSTLRMVFGARVGLLGRKIERKMDRHYLGRIFATLASTLLGLRIYDTQCGAKLFRATVDLDAVLAEPFGNAWVFDVELIARFAALHRGELAGAGKRLPIESVIYELPLKEWRDVAGSKVSDVPHILMHLLHVVIHVCTW